MMRIAGLAAVLIVLAPGRQARAQDVMTQADLLMRVVDLQRLSQPPADGVQSGLFSSWDRAATKAVGGQYPNWDANDDSGNFLGEENGWKVLADLRGPAYWSRIWVDKPAGSVRLEIDGQPALEVEFAKLFDGTQDPFGRPLCYQTAENGGFVCYFPIAFQRRGRILTSGFDGAYQINFNTLAPSARVAPFRPELGEAGKEAQQKVVNLLRTSDADELHTHLFGEGKMMPMMNHGELKRDEKLPDKWDHPGTIRAFYVAIYDTELPDLYALHRLVVRFYFDGERTPSVEAPLIDFFGSPWTRSVYSAFPVGTSRPLDIPGRMMSGGREQLTESWFLYCYYPMPFHKEFAIEIENLGRKPVELHYLLYVDRRPPPDDALHFKARWQRWPTAEAFDLPLLRAAGRGRMVGTVLAVDTPHTAWWGAGDHKAWVDGEQLPRIWGTDTAGYFGDVKPLHLAGHPFHGVTRLERVGKTSLYRWRTSDCLNFHNGLVLALENLQPENNGGVDYAALGYWYGAPTMLDRSYSPITADMLNPRGLRLENAVEVEDRILTPEWGEEVRQRATDSAELSGKRAARIRLQDQPVEIAIPAPAGGKYNLKLRVDPSRRFREIQIAMGGEQLASFRYQKGSDGIYDVGEVELQRGDNVVKVTVDYPTVLDAWILDPVEAAD